MHIATYTDIKNHPRYGLHKLNLGLPFYVAIKNLRVQFFRAPATPLYKVVYLH